MNAPALDTDNQVYLLVAASPGRDLKPDLYGRDPAPEWQVVFAETEWAPYPEFSPLVIRTTIDSELYRWGTGELSEPDSTGMLGLVIESSADLREVVAWARSRLTILHQERRRRLLRYWDPKIWHALEPAGKGDGSVVRSVHYWLSASPSQGEGWYTTPTPEPVMVGPSMTLCARQYERLSAI